jgi:hypothetical protein
MDAITVHKEGGKTAARAAAEGQVSVDGKFSFNELSYRPTLPPLFEDGSWADADKTTTLNLGIDGVPPLQLDVLTVDDGFWKQFGIVTENFDDDDNSSSATANRGNPADLASLFGSMKIGDSISFKLNSDLDPNKALSAAQVKALSGAMAIAQQGDSDVPWDPTKPGLTGSANLSLERVRISDSYGQIREAMRAFAGVDQASIAALAKQFEAGKATAADLLGARFAQASLDIGFESVFKSLVAQETNSTANAPGPQLFRLKCDDGADNTFSTDNTIYISKPYVPGQAGTPPKVLVRTISGDYQQG